MATPAFPRVRLGLAQKKVFDGKQQAMEEAMKLARRMIEKSRSKERVRVALEVIDKGFEKTYGEARISSIIDQHEEFYSIYLISLYIWAHSSSLSEQISDILLVK